MGGHREEGGEKLSKKWKTVEPAGQEAEESEAPKKKKLKAKALEEDVETTIDACKQ